MINPGHILLKFLSVSEVEPVCPDCIECTVFFSSLKNLFMIDGQCFDFQWIGMYNFTSWPRISGNGSQADVCGTVKMLRGQLCQLIRYLCDGILHLVLEWCQLRARSPQVQ